MLETIEIVDRQNHSFAKGQNDICCDALVFVIAKIGTLWGCLLFTLPETVCVWAKEKETVNVHINTVKYVSHHSTHMFSYI